MAAVQWLGLAFAVAMVIVSREPAPPIAALMWGLVAGVSGSLGLTFFYGAMSRGLMSLVAPVSALVAAAVPAVVGVLRGEALDGLQIIGIGLALVAVAINLAADR